MFKNVLRIVFWVCWGFLGLAALMQSMMEKSLLSYLVFVLALINILAASEKDNVGTEWLRKTAIVGNVSILIYCLTRPNVADYSIFLSMVFVLTIYLFSPRLIRESEINPELKGG